MPMVLDPGIPGAGVKGDKCPRAPREGVAKLLLPTLGSGPIAALPQRHGAVWESAKDGCNLDWPTLTCT